MKIRYKNDFSPKNGSSKKRNKKGPKQQTDLFVIRFSSLYGFKKKRNQIKNNRSFVLM